MTLKFSSQYLLKALLYKYIDEIGGYDNLDYDQKISVDQLFKIANN